jgi:hypothetical protein
MDRRYSTPELRALMFWRRVDIRTFSECWKYKGTPRPDGRVRVRVTNREVLVPRAAHEFVYGAVPARHVVRTKCGAGDCANPVHGEVIRCLCDAERPPKKYIPPPLSDHELDELVRQHRAGREWKALAAAVGRNQSTIFRALKRRARREAA